MLGLTREEVLWWHSPELRLRREAFRTYLERGEDWCKEGEYAFRNHISYTRFKEEGHGLSPVGELPVLLYLWGSWRLTSFYQFDAANLFNFEAGWRFNRAYMNDRANWENGQLQGAFTGPNDPAMSTLDRILWVVNDPRTVDLEGIQESDDTKRLVRLIQTAYTRFVLDEAPTVPSLWKEGEQVLCGWNDLFPEDDRVPPAWERQAFRTTSEWNGARIWEPEKWRWRVPRI